MIDESGKPIANVKVWVYWPAGGPIEKGMYGIEKTVYTDVAGRWELSGLPDDLKTLNLRFEHESYSSNKQADCS